MELTKTHRGLDIVKFRDKDGEECSLQESSLMGEYSIWLGVNNPKPEVYTAEDGWQEIKTPRGAIIRSRMHLTVEMVNELLPFLQRFAETGSLGMDTGNEIPTIPAPRPAEGREE